MKNGIAIFMLIMGGLICIALFSAINLIILPFTIGIGYLVSIFLFMMATSKLRCLFREKYSIGSVKFLLLAVLPSLVVSVVLFIVFQNIQWGDKFFGDLFGSLYFLTYSVTTLFLIIGIVIDILIDRYYKKHTMAVTDEKSAREVL